jgi:hypothetical protein
MEVSGQLHAPTALLLTKKTALLFGWKLGGPQSRSGRCGKEKNPCPCWEDNLTFVWARRTFIVSLSPQHDIRYKRSEKRGYTFMHSEHEGTCLMTLTDILAYDIKCQLVSVEVYCTQQELWDCFVWSSYTMVVTLVRLIWLHEPAALNLVLTTRSQGEKNDMPLSEMC